MHEDLKILLSGLMEERAAILEQATPLRARRDAIIAQMQPLEQQAKELANQFLAIERPRLSELDNQIAALHRAMGARSLGNPEPA